MTAVYIGDEVTLATYPTSSPNIRFSDINHFAGPNSTLLITAEATSTALVRTYVLRAQVIGSDGNPLAPAIELARHQIPFQEFSFPQYEPIVTATSTSDNGFLIVWDAGWFFSGSPGRLVAQSVLGSGQLGPERTTLVEGSFSEPQIATLPSTDGARLLIQWNNFNGTVASQHGVIISGEAEVITPEFDLADSYTYNAPIARLPDGGFARLTMSPDETEIGLQLHSAEGALLKSHLLESYPGSTLPKFDSLYVAATVAGRVMAVWTEFTSNGLGPFRGTYTVKGAVITDGEEPIEPFVISSAVYGREADPSVESLVFAGPVVALPNGNFLAIWVEHEGPDELDNAVRGRLYDDTGTPIGEDIFISNRSMDIGSHRNMTPLTVEQAVDGSMLVYWRADLDDFDIRGRFIDAEGIPLGTEITLHRSELGLQASPSVEALPDLTWKATWQIQIPGETELSVVSQLITPSALFTSAYDQVDFNHATARQQAVLSDAVENGRFSDRYQSLNGNDLVTLPDIDLVPTLPGGWDYKQQFNAGGGHDTITTGTGNDQIDGGADTDAVVFQGPSWEYRIRVSDADTITVTDLNRVAGPDGKERNGGVDILRNVEKITFDNGTFSILPNEDVNTPAILFLDFNSPILSSFTPRPFLRNGELLTSWDVASGRMPLAKFSAAQKLAIIEGVQSIFDRSDIPILVVDSNPGFPNGKVLTVLFSTPAAIQSARAASITEWGATHPNWAPSVLLGKAYDTALGGGPSVDRFDARSDGKVAVFVGPNQLSDVIETIAHEAAHGWGVRHVNPSDGPDEVEDYASSQSPEFTDEVTDVREPPRNDNTAPAGFTHNPKFHILEHVLDAVLPADLSGGTWDRGSFEVSAYSVTVTGLSSAITDISITLDMGAWGEDSLVGERIAQSMSAGAQLSFLAADDIPFAISGVIRGPAGPSTVAFIPGDAATPNIWWPKGTLSGPLAGSIVEMTPGGEIKQILGQFLYEKEYSLTVGPNGVASPLQNIPPYAASDALSIEANDVISDVSVLSNDVDFNGDNLTVVALNGVPGLVGSELLLPSGALLTLLSNGSLRYDPNGKFSELRIGETFIETFSYTVSDPHGKTNTAIASIAVIGTNTTASNAAPIVFDVFAGTDEDTAVIGVVEGTDPNLDQLSFSILSPPLHGEVIFNPSTGAFSYTPFADFFGSDYFSFVASDGSLDSEPARVTITVAPINDPAVIEGAKTGVVSEDDVLHASGRLTLIDPDPAETEFRPGRITGSYGNLELAADGAWTYSLDNSLTAVQALATGETLVDTLEILSFDGTSAAITITITGADETASNIAPQITSNGAGETAAIEIAENTSTVTIVAASDPDAGQSLTYAIAGGADADLFRIDGASGALSFITAPDFEIRTDADADNVYDVVVKVSDGAGGSDTQTIAVNVTNVDEAPMVAGTVTLAASAEDIPRLITSAELLAEASDPESQVLGILDLTSSSGALDYHGDGTWTFTPEANDDSSVSFSYLISDGVSGPVAATAMLDLLPVADPAAIGIGGRTGRVKEDETPTAAGALSIIDLDAGEAAFRASTIAGRYGSLVLTAAGAWTYTLNNTSAAVQALRAGETLTDIIQVSSIDGTQAAIEITVDGTNEPLSGNIITGTKKSDCINGTSQDDVITPLAGNDIVNAGRGNDIIKATPKDGTDLYYGDAGSDTIDYSAIASGVTINLGTNVFSWEIDGAGHASGADIGKDVLFSIENAIGGAGNDKINGDNSANKLNGGTGKDAIKGEGGNDLIEGGSGDDTLTGGPGSDTFVFKPGFGRDKITDFGATPKSGQDYIHLGAFGITTANFAEHVGIADIGKDTLITIDGDPNLSILLTGIKDATSITVDDFRFA